MYKAKESFTTKDYDVRRDQLLEDDFTSQDEITDFINAGYIEEFDGSLDITANGTYDVKDYDQAVVNVSGGGGGGLDWSAIGYSSEPQSIEDGYKYAKQIQKEWTPSWFMKEKFQNDYNLMFFPLVDTSVGTNMNSFVRGSVNLIKVPLLDTSNCTNVGGFCYGCSSLKEFPILDISKAEFASGMFTNCPSLTDESLDNILQMYIGATSYTETKTLYTAGFRSNYYPAERIQALPHYQDFIDAGWTIGY